MGGARPIGMVRSIFLQLIFNRITVDIRNGGCESLGKHRLTSTKRPGPVHLTRGARGREALRRLHTYRSGFGWRRSHQTRIRVRGAAERRLHYFLQGAADASHRRRPSGLPRKINCLRNAPSSPLRNAPRAPRNMLAARRPHRSQLRPRRNRYPPLSNDSVCVRRSTCRARSIPARGGAYLTTAPEART